MKRKLPFIICVILLAAIGAYFLLGESGSGTKMPYTEFNAALNEGTVQSVDLYADKVVYKLTDSDNKYQTDNPDRDGFKEELLLKGVEVKDHSNEDSGLNAVLDTVFNLLFIGIILFGLWKLLSAYLNTFKVVRHTGVKFENIAGMKNVKRDLMTVINYMKTPADAGQSRIRPIKGVILEGPPGNGKTLFARALAEECGVKFIATKGADFQSPLMSLGAMKIKLLFRKARRNKPCIVFIDEFDSIGERRNYAGSGIDKENNRNITTMLNEMDGFKPSDGILVIAATNSYESLDPALIRAGRFDLKYHIDNPDAETRFELVNIYTAGKKLSPELTPQHLTDLFNGLSCSEIESILNESAAFAHAENDREITQNDILDAAKKTDVKITHKKAAR